MHVQHTIIEEHSQGTLLLIFSVFDESIILNNLTSITQVRRSLNIIAYTDGYHLHLSSYHRYFNSPNRHIDANVIFLECYGRIYYMTIKDIAPGDELLIFYGAGYSIEMNLDLNEYYKTSPELRAAGLDLNNDTHRYWVDEAGLENYQMRNPPKSFLPFFLKKNTV